MALLIITLIVIYFAPAMLASKKQNFGAILVLNILLGWSGIGWIVALVWALTKDRVYNENHN